MLPRGLSHLSSSGAVLHQMPLPSSGRAYVRLNGFGADVCCKARLTVTSFFQGAFCEDHNKAVPSVITFIASFYLLLFLFGGVVVLSLLNFSPRLDFFPCHLVLSYFRYSQNPLMKFMLQILILTDTTIHDF